jgi:ABC-type Na+ efflux pump permease subunit
MKFFNLVAWISGVLAALIMILGTLSLFLGNNLFGVRHEANYFIAASSLLLLAILCVLASQGCCEKKQK